MKTAVVLFNLGGPDSLAAVRPFLFNLFNDPAIIGLPALPRYLLARLISSRRERKAQGIYAQMGGRSPILPQTETQALALQQALNGDGDGEWRCFVAMRYWHPRAAQTLREVMAWGAERVVLLPLYPQFSTTTSASSLREWRGLAQAAGFAAPTAAICCWPAQSGFIAAMAAETRRKIEAASAHGRPRVLFSAHGLPEKVVRGGDPYVHQVEATVAALVGALGLAGDDYEICYQSRVGPLRWVGPATEACVEAAARAGQPIVMVPVAFVSEHSETLVELDIEYRDLALRHGAPAYLRVPTVQADAGFVAGLAALARIGAQRAGQVQGSIASESGERFCPGEFARCAMAAPAGGAG